MPTLFAASKMVLLSATLIFLPLIVKSHTIALLVDMFTVVTAEAAPGLGVGHYFAPGKLYLFEVVFTPFYRDLSDGGSFTHLNFSVRVIATLKGFFKAPEGVV